ncbi:hypothetical protein NPIL_196251 [Nephila pilipes]|uniref:Uncharacterized protein n=1 Tax=Nephila pilipes TaxID=299642 RepID=A0A8X6R2B5_NEPPI|nr:hypothetical protein NPIL_196251 [Nephila pilipes]
MKPRFGSLRPDDMELCAASLCLRTSIGPQIEMIRTFVYQDTFACWHYKHVRALRVTSCLIDDHTYRSATNFRYSLIPRCGSACNLLNISHQKNSVTNGRMRSVDTSQYRVTVGCPIRRGCSTRKVEQELAKMFLQLGIPLMLLSHLFEVNITWCGDC